MKVVVAIAALLAGCTGVAGAKPLNLDDPRELLDAYVRTVGDTSGEESFVYATVVVSAMRPGEQGRKLFGLEVLGASRFVEIDGGYQRWHREVGLYTDLETGEVLARWHNPLNGRSVDVIHIQNDPVNFRYTVEQQDGPYALQFEELGPYVAFHREFLLRYPSPLGRAEYPLHSAGDWYEAAELFNSFALKSELEDRSRTTVREIGSWARVGPWLPWMEMADADGHLLYHGRSVKLMGGPDELPPRIREYIAAQLPTYLHAPTAMAEPNQTSWTYFKQVLDERTAARAAAEHVLVFGGTGRTGREIVSELRARGARVTVFVRPTSDREAVAAPGVDFVVGDATDAADVDAAMASADFTSVVSAIGKRPGQDVRPDYTANANIVAAAVRHGVDRVLQISSVGAGNSRPHLGDIPAFMNDVLDAKTRAEDELIASGLDFTIIRPGGLRDGEATGQARWSDDVGIVGSTIRRTDLAVLTVRMLLDDSTIGAILHVYDDTLPEPQRE